MGVSTLCSREGGLDTASCEKLFSAVNHEKDASFGDLNTASWLTLGRPRLLPTGRRRPRGVT